MIQTVKEKTWKDETGKEIPRIYVSKDYKMKEHHAGVLLKEAKFINKRLMSFKEMAKVLCNEIYAEAMKKYKVKADGKGNFTWFSFDRSIKVEVSINETIVFDDLMIEASRTKLAEFLDLNLDSKQLFVKEIVADAFQTTKGKLDTKKVLSLLKYRSKITDPLFIEALDLIAESITRPGSKTYFRIWERNGDGKYEIVDLNFSSI